MRVLLLGAPSDDPQSGGEYTLTRDIFQGLMRTDSHGHQFYLPHSGTSPLALPKSFSEISISRSLLRRCIDRLSRLCIGEEGAHRWHAKALKQQRDKYRLDCALCLSPWHFSPILPNIWTVWDLAHRCMPYFPEVSDNGEWDRRERDFRAELPKALAVITGTNTAKMLIERFYGVYSGAIRVIPFPTPSFASVCEETEASNINLPSGISGEFLFYPAQYWPHKNHLCLLKAVRILRDQHQWDGTLVCCGSDKGNLDYLKTSAINLRIDDRVRFLGFVQRNELTALYQRALALTFVSYFGPDNLPPLEAFGLGCPVIASAIDGAEEQLGAAALYANPDSAQDVADTVLRLKHENGLRERLIAAGKARASQSTVEDYASRLIDLLDSLEARFESFRSYGDALPLRTPHSQYAFHPSVGAKLPQSSSCTIAR